jgi:hypothetical protein
MNSTLILLTASFFSTLALGLRPMRASAQDPEHATPSVGVLAGGGIAARPLVRYLAATLHLSPAQTAAVQLAVGKHPWRARTPERLALCLAQVQVLTPNEFDQFLQLQESAAAHNSLRCLARR